MVEDYGSPQLLRGGAHVVSGIVISDPGSTQLYQRETVP
jgi:hypothetical protein